MVVYIRRLAVEKKGWLDDRSFQEGVALCQVIPGATAIQTAGYVGLKTGGIAGAAASFIGFGLPAFLLMTLFSIIYLKTSNLPIFLSLFGGLEALIVAIVANATISFGRNTLKNWKSVVIAVGSASLFALKLHPVIVILFAGFSGYFLNRTGQSPSLVKPGSHAPLRYFRPIVVVLLVATVALTLLYFLRRDLFFLGILMFRIDIFAFGGGFASIPLMFHEIVEVRGWLDSQTFMDGIVLGQVTPGPIVITATFIGYMFQQFPGAIVATICIFLPSFLMLVTILPFFERLKSSAAFNSVIKGILASFVGLLLTVTVRFALETSWNLPHILLAVLALAALIKKIDLLWVVGVGAIFSILVHFIQ